jgi:hypothetical protein
VSSCSAIHQREGQRKRESPFYFDGLRFPRQVKVRIKEAFAVNRPKIKATTTPKKFVEFLSIIYAAKKCM